MARLPEALNPEVQSVMVSPVTNLMHPSSHLMPVLRKKVD